MKRVALFCLAALFALFPARPQSVGLVLSGGGAKGVAHIGFIQALEENDIPIDYITGTSMGAIVGSLYAIGYSPAQMMHLLASPQFARWSTGQMDAKEIYQFAVPDQSPQWVGTHVAMPGDSTSLLNALPTRLINPLPMSEAFMQIYAPSTVAADGDFDNLMVPFRCVASDIYRHKAVAFKSGQLADAVRASMSFPLVFQPIEIDSVLYYDGGLYDIYPINVMVEDFNPDMMIGVDVSSPNTPPGLNDLMGQLENMIMIDSAGVVPPERGVNIRFDLERFGLLDWAEAPQIYAIGYRRGLEMADSIKNRIPARRSLDEVNARRHAFLAEEQPLIFDSLEVDGTTPAKAEYIRYLFNHTRGKAAQIGIAEACSGFYGIASTGRLRNLVPEARYDSVANTTTLRLHADVSPDFHFGLGGFLTTSTSSFIYASARYNPFRLNAFDFSLQGWAGQSYLAAIAEAGYTPKTAIPSHLSLTFEAWRHRTFDSEQMIYDFNAPTFMTLSEVFGRLEWSFAAGRHGIVSVSAAAGRQSRRYRTAAEDPNDNGRDRLTADIAVAAASWRNTTLDDINLPTVGHEYDLDAAVQTGRRHLHSWNDAPFSSPHVYGDFSARMRQYFTLSPNWNLGFDLQGWYSTRPLLGDYAATIVNARAFIPTEGSADLFDPAFRANGWFALGLNPVWNTGRFQFRLLGYGYLPMRRILPTDDGTARYSGWFNQVRFVGEFSAALKLPFGSVRAWVDYRDSPTSRWSVGLSLGTLIRAPRLTR